MVYRVVSTKLTEDEHTAFLDVCTGIGITPSAFLRSLIREKIPNNQSGSVRQERFEERTAVPDGSLADSRIDTSGRKESLIDALVRLSRERKMMQKTNG